MGFRAIVVFDFAGASVTGVANVKNISYIYSGLRLVKITSCKYGLGCIELQARLQSIDCEGSNPESAHRGAKQSNWVSDS